MTDRAFEPADPDPFAQIFKGGGQAESTPTPQPEDDEENPFAKIMSRATAPPPNETSAAGAFGRGVARGALPAVGSLPAIGAGAELGGAGGFALGGPIGGVVGGIAGGLIGGFGGGYAINAVQNWGLKQLPSSWVEKIGMDERQQQLDEGEHPVASFLGGLAPYAVTMRPGAVTKVPLPENATAMQRILAHPATARVFGGAAMGGIELGQEAASDEHIDWRKVAISTGFGVVFNQPTRIGETLTELGARPARRVLGRPEPTAPAVTTPAPETAPEAAPAPVGGAETVPPTAPAEAAPPPAPVTADDFRKEITERTRTGRPYELPPTVAEAADAKVMGPGVTEDVFMGAHEQDTSAALTAQETRRTERSVIGEPPPQPDVHAVARRMDPDTFERYDELRRRAGEFRSWIEEARNPPDHALQEAKDKHDALLAELEAHVAERKGYAGPEARRLRAQARDAQREYDKLNERRGAFAEGKFEETPDTAAARQHLMAVEFELRDLHKDVQAAYRRAADAIGAGTVPAEPHPEVAPTAPLPAAAEAPPIAPELPGIPPAPAGAKTAPAATAGEPEPQLVHVPPPAPPEPPKPKTISEQKAFIADDVKRQLVRAGRPADEAEAAGHLIAARYEARAGHLKGALGNAEELYRTESAEILGPGARSRQPVQQPPRKPKSPERMSLLEFADHLGGLQRTGDLAHTLDQSYKVRGRNLFREDGLTEDKFREAASEAGYLVNNQERTGEKASLKELHEAIKEEAKGKKRYRLGHEPEAPSIEPEQEAHAREAGEGEHPEALEPEERGERPEGELSEEDRRVIEREFMQIDAYHGTPHHFERFDVSKIGTGEGAQAYGHGLYFAEREGVAGEYQRNVKDMAKLDAANKRMSALARVMNKYKKPGTFRDFSDPRGYEAAAEYDHLMAEKMAPGNLYKVSLKPDKVDLLDWDKPISDQPEKIRQIIQSKLGEPSLSKSNVDWAGAMVKLNGRIISEIPKGHAIKENLWDYVRGKDVLPQLSHDPIAQSKILSEAGIPGIKYADQGSRFNLANLPKNQFTDEARSWLERTNGDADAAVKAFRAQNRDEGYKNWSMNEADEVEKVIRQSAKKETHNFVIFDDKDVEITHKNGEPVTGQDRADAVKELFQRGEQLNQSARGSVLFREGHPPLMRLMAEQNASTFVHESGHVFLEELMRDAAHEAAPESLKADAATTLHWLGIESHADLNTGWPGARGRKARAAHERFATGFEQYLREGTAPSQELASVFAKFKNWLLSIYQTLKGLGKPINEDIRQVFDRLLSEEPQRTVIAPDVEAAKSLADHHAIDAAETEPHEAEPVMARVDAERTRAYDEHPDEQSEIEAAIAAKAAFEAEGREAGEGQEPPAHEPSGEAGGGNGGLQEIQRGGGAAGPEPQGGGTGAANGEKRPGINAAGTEGAGLPGAEQRSGSGAQQQSVPLAPSPSATFGPTESPFIDKAGNIRVDNLTTRDDVAQAIRESAEANNDFVGDRRGVVTDGQVMELADALGMDFDKLNKRQIGQAFNAESIMAARKLLIQSATQVSELMKQAAIGTDEDLMAYAMAKDRHQMIQAQVAGITAEAGRALRAFRSIAGQEQAANVNEFLKGATGRTLFQLRMEAKLGASLDTPGKVSKYLADAQKRTFPRMILEYWINGLISGPATHTTYMVGNMILAAEKAGPETAVAALIGNLRKAMGRQGETVRLGEVGAQFRGAAKGLAGGVEAALEAMRSGQTTLLPGEQARPLIPFSGDTALVMAKNSTNQQVKWADVGSQMFGMARGLRDGIVAGAELIKAGGEPGAPAVGFSYSPLGSIPDVAVRGVPVLPVGSAIRLPGRFIAAIHSFFRAVNYSMDKSALAYRIASEEGHTGAAFDARVGDIWQNPSEATMERARHQATELTLMGSGSEFVQALGKLTNTNILGFPLLKFVDPFVHIAGNIIDQSIIQRTPVGLLAPEIRADIMGRNGTVAQDTAMARMLVGTALSVTFGGLAAEGLVSGSGPSDPRQSAMWRLAGNQAHSVRIGDIWYAVNKLGPIGMLLGISADMYEVAHTAAKGDMLEAGAHLQHAFTQNILDESFMRGPSELIRALEDPGRYGEAYIRNFLSSFVPFSVGMSQIARAADPYGREARTVMDAIKAKIPGLSQSLMPRRDVWGEEMPNPEAVLLAGVTAIYERRMSHDPVNQAMLNLGIAPAKLERKIRNVDLTDQQYDDFARIAGRMAKMRLDVIVKSPDYQTWPNHIRHDVISEVIRQSREAARGLMMMKEPQIVKDAVEARRKKMTDDPKGIE